MRRLGYLQHLSSSLYAIYSKVLKIAVGGSFHCIGHHQAVYLRFSACHITHVYLRSEKRSDQIAISRL